ncbi:hypothetical protein RYX45_16230 [Alkalihalophilus pseudofirmus]|uniref:N-acetyltransferase domain-containing protein n=1 Tax=Alkalihalophilus pseudofirmus TaxID=79885 RepID=A0AAJ2U3Y9_ALKPS|nr:hypothetical protein [Alkalihalophilus pseudofirmus]MDV2886741.1 hypothetical protein [Alkalihalophilus pseudofirmus]
MMNSKNKTVSVTADRPLVGKLLQKYRFHDGLRQFRLPSEQQLAMLNAFQTLDVNLALAYTEELIVGYALILSPEPYERWVKMKEIRVLGVVEVAPPYRNQQAASSLLTALLNEGDRWHWDLASVNGDSSLYKKLLQKLLMKGGFEEVLTNEPDIMNYHDNFMMVRFGRDVSSEIVKRFLELSGNPISNNVR